MKFKIFQMEQVSLSGHFFLGRQKIHFQKKVTRSQQLGIPNLRRHWSAQLQWNRLNIPRHVCCCCRSSQTSRSLLVNVSLQTDRTSGRCCRTNIRQSPSVHVRHVRTSSEFEPTTKSEHSLVLMKKLSGSRCQV